MDAANLSFKRISLSVAFALLIPAAGYAQSAFSPSLSNITLSGSTPATETVSSTSGTAITFSATTSYTSGDPQWLCLSAGSASSPTGLSGLITPATFSITIANCGVNVGIFTGTHTAYITLTATDGSGTSPVTIPVSYTVGSGGTTGTGGTGTVTASPSSLTETIAYGQQVGPYFVTLSTTSSTALSFTVSNSASWISWYQYSGTASTISSGSPAVLAITLSGAGQGETTLSTNFVVNTSGGTVNIPITLNNGVSGGSGTGLSVAPTSLSWSYSTSNPGVFPSSTTLTLSDTNGAVSYTATATSSNGWLLVDTGYAAYGTVGVNPLTISPSTNMGSLASGTYSGTVTIVDAANSSATVNVTLSVNGAGSGLLTITPNPISLSAAVNGAEAQATVTVTNTSGVAGVLTASVSGQGLSVSGSGQSVASGGVAYLTIFGNPAGLTNSTYTGSLAVTVGSNTSTANINFTVGTGSGSTSTAATPTSLTFDYEPNVNMQATQVQEVYLTGSGAFTVTSSTVGTASNWLASASNSGTLPGPLYIETTASGLASGTYNGYVTVTNTTTGQTTVINVTLLVQGVTTIYSSPGDWIFNYISGGSTVTQQTFTVFSSDSTAVPLTATVSNPSSTPWLTVTGSGSAPLSITVTANASGLANGVYSGSITVTGGYNTLAIPIVLTVAGSNVSGTGPLTLSASSLNLQAASNGAAASQVVSVSAASSTVFTVSAQGNYNGITWLTVSPVGTLATATSITVTASPASLPNGTYSGDVYLVVNGTTQTIPVTFVVGTTANNIVVTANGGSSTSPTLSFSASAIGATLPTQYLSVTSGAGQSSVVFTASASTGSGGNWIQLSTAAGVQYATPLTETVSVNTAGLAAGTYNGTITISSTSGSAVSVPVTLTITGAPGISVSSTSLSFTYQAGGATPATQTVPVTVSNGSSATYTATAASVPAGWLVVSPTSGTAPSSLTVSINPAGLSAGTYSGSITVTGSSGATGSATVNVSLTVSVPLPTITAVVNGGSFVNEPISPGEIITIGGTNLGPSTPLSFTLSGNVVPTSLGGVQVLINGRPAPLLYVSTTQINAVVPYEIAGILNPTVLVETNVSAGSPTGTSSNGFVVNGAATAPGIFTANGSGTGPGAILNADYSSNVTTPTARGGVVQVFMTGEGQTAPAGVDGKVTTTTPPYPAPLVPIAITVAGQPANYEYAGEAPGLVSGVMQLNVIIPPTLTVTGNVPLLVTIGSATSQGGVTVNIK